MSYSLEHKIVATTQNIIDRSPNRIYCLADLSTLYSETSYEVAKTREHKKHFSREKFISLLLEQGVFKIIKLHSPYSNPPIRYAHKAVSPYELALSIQKNAYLSHQTAAFLHNLTPYELPTIYVNREQTAKTRWEGHLTQQALNLAFSRKQRYSKFVLRYGKTRITILSGKNTNRLGVQQIQDRRGVSLDLTGLERTLIDITVRPGYARGVNHVLQCFKAAKEKIDLKKLVTLLKALDYVYPYHQALGFYLQKAGVKPDSWADLKREGLQYDFYLAHGESKLKYDADWRIHYPADLEL